MVRVSGNYARVDTGDGSVVVDDENRPPTGSPPPRSRLRFWMQVDVRDAWQTRRPGGSSTADRRETVRASRRRASAGVFRGRGPSMQRLAILLAVISGLVIGVVAAVVTPSRAQ